MLQKDTIQAITAPTQPAQLRNLITDPVLNQIDRKQAGSNTGRHLHTATNPVTILESSDCSKTMAIKKHLEKQIRVQNSYN